LRKNVKNFADKRDKGFPLLIQVGLAYMEAGLLERKNGDYFRQVTLVVERRVTSKFGLKMQFQPSFKAPSPQKLATIPEIHSIFFPAVY
jgi:hypothetical protein